MRPIRVLAAIAIASGTFVAIACSVEVDITNKACPCGPGYVCDTIRNVCITPEEFARLDGAVLLTDGAVIVPDATPPCMDDKCPCQSDVDCHDPTRSKCQPDTKICVECVKTPSDTCPVGQYCNDLNQCTLGCKQESDCQISPAVPHCNVTSHQCVQCLTPTDCPGDAGLLCSPSGNCVEGCNLEGGVGCPGTKTCCGGFCLDLQTDLLNCGACDKKCSTTNGTPICAGGNCDWPINNCASGFRHCQSGNTGCDTNIRLPANCGSCTNNCLATVINADNVFCNTQLNGGTCSYGSCKLGFGNCDDNRVNGCECSCGSFAGEICCPGPVVPCTFDGGKCVGQNPAKCQ
jgi:hypothetical protein